MKKILLLPLLRICFVTAFVVIKPGYQPSRLPEAPFFLGKCKNNVKASERKLTVSIYAKINSSPWILLMRNSSAKLKPVAFCVKLWIFELRMMSWHWMKMNILVVSLIVWTMGIRQQSAEIAEDMSEEAEASNEVVQVRPSETTVRTTRSGRTPRTRDQSLYLLYDWQSDIHAY